MSKSNKKIRNLEFDECNAIGSIQKQKVLKG